jgi:hypothetical protein
MVQVAFRPAIVPGGGVVATIVSLARQGSDAPSQTSAVHVVAGYCLVLGLLYMTGLGG